MEMLEKPLALVFVKMGNHLAVRARLELVAALHQLLTKLAEVVNFAIEHHPDRLVLIGDRLAAARQIDDRKPLKSQSNRRMVISAFVVRPAVTHRVRREFQLLLGRNLAALAEKSNDPAHIVMPG